MCCRVGLFRTPNLQRGRSSPMRRRAYRAMSVKNLKIENVLAELAAGPIWVGLDVGKGEVFAVVRDRPGHFTRPWKTKQPSEIGGLITVLRGLAAVRPLVVAMESTGTYGDALRQAATDAQLDAHRVSGKATHDYAEIFDGVPSAHDGKDAAMIAELACFGKSCPWPYQAKSPGDSEIDSLVGWLDVQQGILRTWQGRLEAMLARHWPESTEILSLGSATLLRVCVHYGGPRPLSDDSSAESRLAAWGGHLLKSEKIERLLASAKTTVGVRMDEQDSLRLGRYATGALQAHGEVEQSKRRLEHLADEDPRLARMAQVVGRVTACVLWSVLGDPNRYHCGAAYIKAMGLNLKERSSGKYQGKLKITKRGSGVARRCLYFAAMRQVQTRPVRDWYEAKKGRDGDRGRVALIAVTRKLGLALHAVASGEQPFDAWCLFPGCDVKQRKD